MIGGCGHVGLPLALTFSDIGLRTVIYDINEAAVASVRSGQVPFAEEGAPAMLHRALERQLLEVTTAPDLLAECHYLVLVIGTPVDEHLNPTFSAIHRTLDKCIPHLRDGQILILRSTVFPGISAYVQRYLREQGRDVHVAFCPERVAQGYSIREFRDLPQIISAFDEPALSAVRSLFGKFAVETIEMTPMEAELCKLMTNAWRYIQFATTNQFYMIATQNGADFDRILHGCRHNYPRMRGMPGPGFAAGPCLVKDTMQLAAFSRNQFVIGHAAMLINEGLPAFLIEQAKRSIDLGQATAGILGMAFKCDSDDPRDSLSFKLRKLLTMECQRVLCHDPHVEGDYLVPLATLLAESDVVFVATPHTAYRGLGVPARCVVVDVWNVLGQPAEQTPAAAEEQAGRTAVRSDS